MFKRNSALQFLFNILLIQFIFALSVALMSSLFLNRGIGLYAATSNIILEIILLSVVFLVFAKFNNIKGVFLKQNIISVLQVLFIALAVIAIAFTSLTENTRAFTQLFMIKFDAVSIVCICTALLLDTVKN